MNIRRRVNIIGDVQGVSFRYFLKAEADKLKVKGYAKNLWNGSVEAVFEGEFEKVRDLIKACKMGSRAAKVKEIKITREEHKGEFNSFSIL